MIPATPDPATTEDIALSLTIKNFHAPAQEIVMGETVKNVRRVSFLTDCDQRLR